MTFYSTLASYLACSECQMQTCIWEINFVACHLAVKTRDGNKIKKLGHYLIDNQLECDLNMVNMLLKSEINPASKNTVLQLCERAADATQRMFCALCLFSPPLSVRSAGLWECGAALQAWNSSFLPGISWLSDRPTQLSLLCLHCWHLPFTATVSHLKDFADPLHCHILYLSLCRHLEIWHVPKFFICNPGSRCLTAALYFFRAMVCVSLILAEVVNMVSDCQKNISNTFKPPMTPAIPTRWTSVYSVSACSHSELKIKYSWINIQYLYFTDLFSFLWGSPQVSTRPQHH